MNENVIEVGGIMYLKLPGGKIAAEIDHFDEAGLPVLKTETVETINGEKKSVEVKVKCFKLASKSQGQ